MEIVNLTPHPINLQTKSGSITIPVSGRVLRIKTERLEVGMIHISEHAIPLVYETYSGADDLPTPKDGTYFIVSRLVAEKFPERSDFLYPTELQRAGDGSIQSALSLGVCHPVILLKLG